ncbi:hypothetical protein [Streptomyces sp. NPDC056549]|uniref:hypothetical protein n=1 Tax=Streptomyces sp. NPDC056549 TaxID=3345864 RepID=UPI0036AA3E0E
MRLLKPMLQDGASGASEANLAVTAYRDRMIDPASTGESKEAALREAREKLRAITPSLTVAQVDLITEHAKRARAVISGFKEAREDVTRKTVELIRVSRVMLKSEDDVAPAVPPQRRRWWRAAQTETVQAGAESA